MRPATGARLALGAVGLVATRQVLPWWGADPDAPRVVAVARVLAARHLLQGAVVAARPTRRVEVVSAATDLLHALTMVALATGSRTYRRPAATSACVSVSLAGATVAGLRRPSGDAADDPDEAGDPNPSRAVAAVAIDRDATVVRDEPPAADDRGEGTDSSVQRLEGDAHRRAAWLTQRTEHALAVTTEAPMPPLSRAGAVVLLAVGVWLVIGQWVLSLPMTSDSASTNVRDQAFAVVLALAALRLLVARRSNAATGVTFLGGVLLVCAGVLLPHSVTRSAVDEVVCGGMVLLCAAATLDRWRAGARDTEDRFVVSRA